MSSGVSSPDEGSAGWHLEFNYSDWWDEMCTERRDRMGEPMDIHKMELDSKYDNVGWGLLFLLLGALALPNGTAEYGSVAVVGAAMLGLNGLRVVAGLPLRWFSIILGAVMLVAGTGALTGLHLDVFVLFFLLAGVVTIASALIQPGRTTAT
jgi:hypothetical protein